MNYYIGQSFGIIGSILCAVMPLFGKKKQMLICSGASALCFGLNLFFLGETGSGFIISIVCVVQTIVAIWHVDRNRPVTTLENLLFLFLYVACGMAGFRRVLDILPIIASIFNMLAAFQRNVQKSRILILGNALSFLVYYLSIGSTSAIAEIIALVTTSFALINGHRKRQP